jgi:hypothetical protein
MCDKIGTKFQTQTSTEKILFRPNNISIPYVGPTIPDSTKLTSRSNTIATITDGIEFEQIGDICSRITYLETNGILKIKNIVSGGYQTFGGKLEFKELYFFFSDLIMNIKVRYYFNPFTICKDDIQKMNNDENRPFMVIIDDTKGISFDKDKYFVTNSEDRNNINPLFFDLIPSLSNYNSEFGPFFDQFVAPIMNQTGFGIQIGKEFNRVYCEEYHKQTQVKFEDLDLYHIYEDRVDRLKRMGIYDIFHN